MQHNEIQWTPAISRSQGNGKLFKIARFAIVRVGVKFRNIIFNKTEPASVQIINLSPYNIKRLFNGKLCNTAGYFYESVFIFSSL